MENVYSTENLTSYTATEPLYSGFPYELINKNSESLKVKTKEFDFSDSTVSPEEIAENLIATAKQYNVLTVAANQCGLDHRVFVAGTGDEFVAFFNPKIVIASTKEVALPEVNILDITLMIKHVKRPSSITVEYQDFNGMTHITEFSGLSCRLIQHNIDVLDGLDFKRLISPLKLERSKKASEKKIKKQFRTFVSRVGRV